MSVNEPTGYEKRDVAAGYNGPHRRSTDLSTGLRGKSTVRIRVINVILIVLAGLIALALLLTIEGKQALLEASMGEFPRAAYEEFSALIERQLILTGLLILVVVLTIVSVTLLVLRPMQEFLARIRENKMLPMRGSYELQYFAKAYNVMYEGNLRHNEELRYKVEHDHLTGLYNRGAFEKLRETHEADSIALLLIDVDKFKEVNDVYGHDVGDKVLQKVAALLDHSFRASDYACRIGGDEFAVIMTDMAPEQRQAVLDKIETVKLGLRDTADGLPAATLSVGVAFSTQREDGGDNLFKMADKALYRVKEGGRNGCAFYDGAEKE